MATYLLLRNNKQQGPLSLQHLIQLGLKPYDLVWVEGKSAAWRYPSEIPELKPYSAAVEEQPFDRFYKKPEEKIETSAIADTPSIVFPEEIEIPKTVHAEPVRRPQAETVKTINGVPDIVFPEEIGIQKNVHAEPVRRPQAETVKTINAVPDIVFPDDEEYQQYMPQVEKKEEKVYQKKTVYVTMPLQSMHEPKQEIKQEPVYKRQEPVFNLQSSPVTDPYEEPAPLNTKYSQPLDEIKEMYVQKLHERKKQSAQKKFIVAGIKKAAVVIGIISVGIIIGFAIKPKNNSDRLAATNTTRQKAIEVTDDPIPNENNEVIQKQGSTTIINHPSFDQQGKSKKKTIQEQQPGQRKYEPIETKPVVSENKKAVMQKQKPAVEEKDETVIYKPAPGVETNSSGERTKKTRNESDDNTYSNDDERNNDSKSSSSKASISDMVSLKSNDYYVVAFGGIRNLQLTVENDSKYVLDKVTVKVDYVRPNGATLKSDNIQFKGVSANGSSTIRVPDTNRGVKVYYKIVKIESKEFKNDMAGL